jgi:hypothetical protein
VIHHDRLGAFQLAGHGRHRRHVLGGEAEAHGGFQRHPVDLLHEIQVPVVAAQLAVGDGLQADCFLLRDDGTNGAIFDFLELRALGLARRRELRRAQQASYMIGVERRRLAHR